MTSHALGYGICLLNNRADKLVLTKLTAKEIHYAVGTMNRDCIIFCKYFFRTVRTYESFWISSSIGGDCGAKPKTATPKSSYSGQNTPHSESLGAIRTDFVCCLSVCNKDCTLLQQLMSAIKAVQDIFLKTVLSISR